MSFVLEIDVPDLSSERAEAVVTEVTRRGGWPLRVHRKGLLRQRFSFWSPSDDDGEHLLTDNAGWDEAAWDMNPNLLPRLAETITVLGEHLPKGFSFRATWVNDPVRDERVLSADQLAELVLASALNEYTLYRVVSARAE